MTDQLMNVGGGGFRKYLMCVVSEASWLHMTALIPAPHGHYTPQSLQFQTQMAHPICNVGSRTSATPLCYALLVWEFLRSV